MAEALAVFHAMKWAKERWLNAVEIWSDSVDVVEGLRNINLANVLVQPVLIDIVNLVDTFDQVIVLKVPRHDAVLAHALAKIVYLG